MTDPTLSDRPPLWGGCEAWPAWADNAAWHAPEDDPTSPCCEAWPAWANSVAWHALEGDPTVLVMPHLAGTRHRLNYCPSCGADRRSATSTPFPPAER